MGRPNFGINPNKKLLYYYYNFLSAFLGLNLLDVGRATAQRNSIIMTKMSANPRKYSKGVEHLNPERPLNVYMKLRTDNSDLDLTLARIDLLKEKHSSSVSQIVERYKEDGDTILILEVSMGPAREALQGTSLQVHSGYRLLWDVAKTLFYARPILTAPPGLGKLQNFNL